MSDQPQLTISLSVDVPSDDLTTIPTIYEVLARAAAGLLMAGIESRLYTFSEKEN